MDADQLVLVQRPAEGLVINTDSSGVQRMGDILIRDVDEQVVHRLKSRAKLNGTSLQAEAREALATGASLAADERRRLFDDLDQLWGDRPKSTIGGAEIMREVRDENGW